MGVPFALCLGPESSASSAHGSCNPGDTGEQNHDLQILLHSSGQHSISVDPSLCFHPTFSRSSMLTRSVLPTLGVHNPTCGPGPGLSHSSFLPSLSRNTLARLAKATTEKHPIRQPSPRIIHMSEQHSRQRLLDLGRALSTTRPLLSTRAPLSLSHVCTLFWPENTFSACSPKICVPGETSSETHTHTPLWIIPEAFTPHSCEASLLHAKTCSSTSVTYPDCCHQAGFFQAEG